MEPVVKKEKMKRFYRLIEGDCSQVLHTIPDEAINLVVTSPPYWGLRDYGSSTETVWNGNPDCEHKWGKEFLGDTRTCNTFKHRWQNTPKPDNVPFPHIKVSQGTICSKCGAWRGQLGLEPTWQLYIQHLVEVSREIKRVLRKDGSYYLNLGDTYFSGGGPSRHWGYFDPKYPEGRKVNYLEPQASMEVDNKVNQPKQKLFIPYRVAIALQEDGWICRNDITWQKPNAMPSSVKDRLSVTTERIFHFVKNRRYYYNLDAIRMPHKTFNQESKRSNFNNQVFYDEKAPNQVGKSRVGRSRAEDFNSKGKNPGDVIKHDVAVGRIGNFSYSDPLHTKDYHPFGRNPGDFWPINTKPFKGAHFAVFPEALVEPIIKSSSPEKGTVLDPFLGSGTTMKVARDLGRNCIGIEINHDYCEITKRRVFNNTLLGDIDYSYETFKK